MSATADDKKPTVVLSGTDGNVFALLGRCRRAAKDAGWTQDQMRAFAERVMNSKSYDEALQCMMREFDVL